MTKTMLALSLAALIALPLAAAQAETASSYSMKKQGRVPFTQETQEPAAQQQTETPEATPQNIEPAAGAEEPAAQQTDADRSALEDQIRLPRKN